jgi:Mg/Co/Ni transporter MgtE
MKVIWDEFTDSWIFGAICGIIGLGIVIWFISWFVNNFGGGLK